MQKVLIIGFGYVGSFLASHLSSCKISVTTTSFEKKELLEKTFSSVYLYPSSNPHFLETILEEIDCLVILVAAKNKDLYEKTYLDTAKAIRSALVNRKKKLSLIYTSSTSVYGDHEGRKVTEESPLYPANEQANILRETENVYLEMQSSIINVCIFRLGEIYGPGREISKRVVALQRKAAPGNGKQISNMIHVEDIAHAIKFAMQNELQGIFNLCDEDTYSRKEMYDLVCNFLGLEKIAFNQDSPSIHKGDKKVISQKIKKKGFIFLYPHRMWGEA